MFFLTISGKTVEAFNKDRGYKETWDFYKIPDAFALSLAKAANEQKKLKPIERRTAAKITIPSSRGGEVKVATGSEYEKPVTVKGSGPDSSLTVQLSKDGKKFRATIEIESNKSNRCSGTIGMDGKIKSEECEFPSMLNGYSRLSGKFPSFIFNESGECLGTMGGNFCASAALETPHSFEYPHSIETKAIATAEEKKRLELAKKAAEEKIRQELAKKAAEEKKRRELAKKAAEEKKRRELAKKAAEEKKRQALAKKAADEKKRQELAKKAAEEKKRQELAKKAAYEKKRRELAKKAAEEKKRQELARQAAEEKKRQESAKEAAEERRPVESTQGKKKARW